MENTSLAFDQVADCCKLHPLEVKAIADGDAAQGVKGLNPVLSGQFTREEIAKGEAEYTSEINSQITFLPECGSGIHLFGGFRLGSFLAGR